MADMNGLDICKRHNKPFEVYCEDHKVFACSTCVIVNHKACSEVVDVESLSELCTCLDDLKLGLRKSEEAIYQSIGNIEEAQTCLTNDVDDVEENLSKMRTKLIDTFDIFAEKIMVEANSYRDLKDAALTKQKIECENEMTSIQSSRTHVNEISAQGTRAQHAITAHTLADEIKNKMGNAESLSTQLNTINISMNFDELFDTMEREVALALNPREFERKYSVSRKWKLNPLASIDLKRTGDDVKEPYYVGLDFLPDGRLIAVDRNNRRCLIYDEHLTVLSVYNVAIRPNRISSRV